MDDGTGNLALLKPGIAYSDEYYQKEEYNEELEHRMKPQVFLDEYRGIADEFKRYFSVEQIGISGCEYA